MADVTPPDPLKVALPVVYMLVRRVPRENNRELLRTEIRFGVVNNANREQVTSDGKWLLACVIGPFDNMVQAKAFHAMWRNIATHNGIASTEGGACRGSARIARGMQLANVWGAHPWVDFSAVFGRKLCYHEIVADGKKLCARALA